MKLLFGIVTLAVLTAMAACSGDDNESDPNAGDSSVQEITSRMTDDLAFEPAEIRVDAGTPVRLTLDNSESTVVHDFTVDEMPVTDVVYAVPSPAEGHGEAHGEQPDLHASFSAGESGVVAFTPTEPGAYTYECSEAGHADGGMTGVIIVS